MRNLGHWVVWAVQIAFGQDDGVCKTDLPRGLRIFRDGLSPIHCIKCRDKMGKPKIPGQRKGKEGLHHRRRISEPRGFDEYRLHRCDLPISRLLQKMSERVDKFPARRTADATGCELNRL